MGQKSPFPLWVEGRCPHRVPEDAWALAFWIPEVPRDSTEQAKWGFSQVCVLSAVETHGSLAEGSCGGGGTAYLPSHS